MSRPPSHRDVKRSEVLGPDNGKDQKKRKPFQLGPQSDRWWWNAEVGSEDEARRCTATINALTLQNVEIELAHLRWHRLYEGIQSMGGMLGYTSAAAHFLSSHSLRNYGAGPAYNVIESCCDTATAKMGADVARPLVRTTGGDYKMQRKAKSANKWLRGMLAQVDGDHQAVRTFLDGCVEGTGTLHVFNDDGEIKMDRVWVNELVVDAGDAMYGAPRTIYRRQFVPREILLTRYPTKAAEINMLPRDELGWRQQQADLVLTVEAHHLPSKEGATDGRHVVCCGNVNLYSKRWKRMSLPYAHFRWKERQNGYWGKGIAEQLLALQVEINRVLMKISQAHNLVGIPSVWVKMGDKINKSHLNNEIGHIGVYQTEPPVYMTPAPVNVQANEYLDSLFAKAYQLMGISEMSSQGVKPAGLNSEPGMEAYRDIEDERFSDKEKQRDRLIVDVAKLLFEEAIDISEEGGDVIVHMESDGYDDEIEWSAFDLKRDEYEITIEPISELPDTYAGRLNQATQATQLGVMTPVEAFAAYELGDVSPQMRMMTAPVEDILQCLDKIVEDGEYTPCSPGMELDLAEKWGNAAYLRARDKRSKVPEERLEMLLQFVEDAQHWKGLALQAPPPGGGAPLARGGQLPVNPALPPGQMGPPQQQLAA